MIDEDSDVLGWNRKHAIKALNGKVGLGKRLEDEVPRQPTPRRKRLSSSGIWKHSERPCGTRLMQTLPLWLDSCQALHGSIEVSAYQKILTDQNQAKCWVS
jgi:hypothetical protein